MFTLSLNFFKRHICCLHNAKFVPTSSFPLIVMQLILTLEIFARHSLLYVRPWFFFYGKSTCLTMLRWTTCWFGLFTYSLSWKLLTMYTWNLILKLALNWCLQQLWSALSIYFIFLNKSILAALYVKPYDKIVIFYYC